MFVASASADVSHVFNCVLLDSLLENFKHWGFDAQNIIVFSRLFSCAFTIVISCATPECAIDPLCDATNPAHGDAFQRLPGNHSMLCARRTCEEGLSVWPFPRCGVV